MSFLTKSTTFFALLTVSVFLALPKSFASDDDSASKSPADLKGRINNEVSHKSASESAKIEGLIFLRANIESIGQGGRKFDVEPYYTEESKLSNQEFSKLANSPLVQSRLALWKAWYGRLYDELSDGLTIPKGLREKVSITINKDKKITATTEWIDPSENPEVQQTSKALVAKIRNFSGSDWIQFPEKSYLELVTLQFFVGEDHLQLDNGTQKLDCE